MQYICDHLSVHILSHKIYPGLSYPLKILSKSVYISPAHHISWPVCISTLIYSGLFIFPHLSQFVHTHPHLSMSVHPPIPYIPVCLYFLPPPNLSWPVRISTLIFSGLFISPHLSQPVHNHPRLSPSVHPPPTNSIYPSLFISSPPKSILVCSFHLFIYPSLFMYPPLSLICPSLLI